MVLSQPSNMLQIDCNEIMTYEIWISLLHLFEVVNVQVPNASKVWFKHIVPPFVHVSSQIKQRILPEKVVIVCFSNSHVSYYVITFSSRHRLDQVTREICPKKS